MVETSKSHFVLITLAVLLFLLSAAVGILLGISLATMENLGKLDSFNNKNAALPTQILDIKGRLITEFFSDEKRELVKLDELPAHLGLALVTREDQDFFLHRGFSIRGLSRAAWNILTGSYVSGGSTITQQLATANYLDKREFSITRKLKEIWYAVQIERHWSKQEILEEYLNKMPFGHNTHGVEAASQFFFGHPAKELTVAESVILVLQVSSPGGLYSPLKNPSRARDRQVEILNQMVDLHYVSREEADKSLKKYWDSFDYTRSASETAFFNRVDLAPYFSEYIRGLLENQYLLGDSDIYRDGYRVYTTLNLDYQKAADEYMSTGISEANIKFRKNLDSRAISGTEGLVPIIDALSISFNIPSLRVGGTRQLNTSRKDYIENITPVLDLISLQFGYEGDRNLRTAVDKSYELSRKLSKRTTVEGALISLDHTNGYIVAMVGGSQFESSNQFNRATQARIQPGSSFKPLFYAAGIDSGIITPATLINDTKIQFIDDDGTSYQPLNFRGEFVGPVLVRQALIHSMNIPSIRILNRIGFDDAIRVSSRLLGIPQDQLEARNFQRKYPLALGIISVSPLEMAKAFSVFPNLGKDLSPIAIRYIEDRNGNIISQPEKEIRQELLAQGSANQIIAPSSAYIMTDLLQSTVKEGTLASARYGVGGFTMPMAGKTGTPQNWSAAWTVGFSPYITTAVWLGTDEGNISLGLDQTGATAAGPIWARYMKEIHKDLTPKNFSRPESGINYVTVTRNSGLLPPPGYKGQTMLEIFKTGTEPHAFDTMAEYDEQRQTDITTKLQNTFETNPSINSPDFMTEDLTDRFILSDDLDWDIPATLDDIIPSPQPSQNPSSSPRPQPSAGDQDLNSLLFSD